MTKHFKPGKYKHYKGKNYIAVGLANHSEDLQSMVIYAPLYKDSGLWVRPQVMFLEKVEIDGVMQARFEYVGEASPEEIAQIKPYFNGLL